MNKEIVTQVLGLISRSPRPFNVLIQSLLRAVDVYMKDGVISDEDYDKLYKMILNLSNELQRAIR